jgi:hypothetical protein
MTQTEPVGPGGTDGTDGTGSTGTTDGTGSSTGSSTGSTDWTGRTVRGRDGSRLGTLVELMPGDANAPSGWGVVRSSLGKRRLVPLDGAVADGDRDLTVAADRASVRTAPVLGSPGAGTPETTGELQRHYTGRGVLADARALQHERYGGAKIGAAFFGWLVAVGLTVLLGVLAGVVSAALGAQQAQVGLIIPVVVLVVAYFVGGYVAGRLARFDGARNGFLSWVIGVLASVALAVVAAFVGAQYDVLSRVSLPALPTGLDQVTWSGVLAAAVAVVGTLLAAVLGGRVGEGYHRRVDRAAADAL